MRRSLVMGAPSLVIRLPLEGAPQVLLDCLDDREEERLTDWLEAHPDYAELSTRALELTTRGRCG